MSYNVKNLNVTQRLDGTLLTCKEKFYKILYQTCIIISFVTDFGNTSCFKWHEIIAMTEDNEIHNI